MASAEVTAVTVLEQVDQMVFVAKSDVSLHWLYSLTSPPLQHWHFLYSSCTPSSTDVLLKRYGNCIVNSDLKRSTLPLV